MKNIKNGFTLVELIIVITILAILGSIAFVSYSGYISHSNDVKNLSNIKNIETGLLIFETKSGKYPIPSNSGEITGSGNILFYQGNIDKNYSGILGINYPLDSSNNTEYKISIGAKQKSYQISTYLNDLEYTYSNKIFADYKNIYSIGNSIGILYDENNNFINTDVEIFDGNIFNILNGNSIQTLSGDLLISTIINNNINLFNDENIIGLDKTLALYYDFDHFYNDMTNLYVKDLSYYGNNLECRGSLGSGCEKYAFLKMKDSFGNGMIFNGNNYGAFSLAKFYTMPENDVTVSGLFRTNDVQIQRYIFNTSSNGASGIRYGLSQGAPMILYGTNGTGYQYYEENTSNYKFSDNRVYQMTIVYKLNDKVITYIDGIKYGEDDISGYGNYGALKNSQRGLIGLMGSKYFVGAVDDLRVFNRALTDDEIFKLAKNKFKN